MQNELSIAGIKVDLSNVATDGRSWRGEILFLRDGATVRGMWIGFDGSDMGELVDVEGEDEALCEAVDALGSHEEIFAALGDPCDVHGRRERAMWRETEWAIREAMEC